MSAQPPLTPDEIAAAAARPARFTAEDYRSKATWYRDPPEVALRDNEVADMLDAAAEMAQPKSCATCRSDADYSAYCERDVRRPAETLEEQLAFGCTLWSPREK